MSDRRREEAWSLLQAELGEVILAEWNSPTITDLHLNASGSVVSEGPGGANLLDLEVSDRQREGIASTVAGMVDMVIHADSPWVGALLDEMSARVSLLVPPVVPSAALTFRKVPRIAWSLDAYVSRAILTEGQVEVLRGIMSRRESVILSGGTGTGKTTLASALISDLLDRHPLYRVVAIEEETPELKFSGCNVVRMLSEPRAGHVVGHVNGLLRIALRLSPDSIVLGEARGGELYSWFRAQNTGHGGSVVTLHAESAGEVLGRMVDMVSEAGVSMRPERMASAVQWIAQLVKDPLTNDRSVEGIYRVEVNEGAVQLIPALGDGG